MDLTGNVITQEDEKIISIAMVCHYANKGWCEAFGDNSQKNWYEAEQWQRDAAIAGVKFRLENPEAADATQHEFWMKEKVDAGWVYGAVKDPEKKTHPCIVPFNDLPDFERKKDRLFGAIVDCLK